MSCGVSSPFTPRPHTRCTRAADRDPPAPRPYERTAPCLLSGLLDGEEIRASDNDTLTVNENTGVLSVHRVDGFEEVTTHYSPSAWASVTHRVKNTSCGARWPAPRSRELPRQVWPSDEVGGPCYNRMYVRIPGNRRPGLRRNRPWSSASPSRSGSNRPRPRHKRGRRQLWMRPAGPRRPRRAYRPRGADAGSPARSRWPDGIRRRGVTGIWASPKPWCTRCRTRWRHWKPGC